MDNFPHQRRRGGQRAAAGDPRRPHARGRLDVPAVPRSGLLREVELFQLRRAAADERGRDGPRRRVRPRDASWHDATGRVRDATDDDGAAARDVRRRARRQPDGRRRRRRPDDVDRGAVRGVRGTHHREGRRHDQVPPGASHALVPTRPRRRGERRSLRTFPGASLRSSLAFNPDTPRRLSTPLLTPFNSTHDRVPPVRHRRQAGHEARRRDGDDDGVARGGAGGAGARARGDGARRYAE
eukprot:31263-Pelagococcus_subviridis.AAC.4